MDQGVFDSQDYRKNLGLRLRSLRQGLGETQVQLAKRLGVTELTALKYENGATCPTAEHLHRLEVSGIDASYVAFGYPSLGNPSARKDFAMTLKWVQRQCRIASLKHTDEEQLELAWHIFCTVCKAVNEDTDIDVDAINAKLYIIKPATPKQGESEGHGLLPVLARSFETFISKMTSSRS
jgi:transcriptional regulator with XRE-family HTH domain